MGVGLAMVRRLMAGPTSTKRLISLQFFVGRNACFELGLLVRPELLRVQPGLLPCLFAQTPHHFPGLAAAVLERTMCSYSLSVFPTDYSPVRTDHGENLVDICS